MTLTPQKIAKLRRFEGLFNLSTGTAVQAANELIEALPDMLDAADKLARLTALLDELRPLEAKATPGPWEKANCGGPPYALIPSVVHRYTFEMDGRQCRDWLPVAWFGDAAGDVESNEPEHDRELICANRNALAEMLRVVGS